MLRSAGSVAFLFSLLVTIAVALVIWAGGNSFIIAVVAGCAVGLIVFTGTYAGIKLYRENRAHSRK
jgi:hypothetical protein